MFIPHLFASSKFVIHLVSNTHAGFLILSAIGCHLISLNSSHSVRIKIASESLEDSIIELQKDQEPSTAEIEIFLFSIWSRSDSICFLLTLGSYIFKLTPSSKSSLQIFMAGDSLVSFVFPLKANPKIAIFLPDNVPNNLSTISLEILFCCQLFISITFCQYAETSFRP